MEEYKRIQKVYRNFILPVKIISFSFCFLILTQDVTLSIKHYYNYPFTVVTKFPEITLTETPTLSICIAHQFNLTKFRLKFYQLYSRAAAYYEEDYARFRSIVFSELTAQDALDITSRLEEVGTCSVLIPTNKYVPCNYTDPYIMNITPFRTCYSFFERQLLNNSKYVYKPKVLQKRPWVSITLRKSDMRRRWVDVCLNTIPKASLVYHGFPGFISFSTNYYKHIKINTQMNTIRKLKYPFKNDCLDYFNDENGCYSRESCLEVCYANLSLNEYSKWPKNLQTFNGVRNLSTVYFSNAEDGVERLREICGARYPKSDCFVTTFDARVIEEEMISRRNAASNHKFKLYIYANFRTENRITYKPSYSDNQLLHEITTSVASFLGFCVFDIYKLFIYLYNLIYLK